MPHPRFLTTAVLPIIISHASDNTAETTAAVEESVSLLSEPVRRFFAVATAIAGLLAILALVFLLVALAIRIINDCWW